MLVTGRRAVLFAWAALLAAGAALLVAGCNSAPPPPPPDDRPYEQRILAWRTDKDAMFRHVPQTAKEKEDDPSPIPIDQRATFHGLAYYPIDPAYRLPASLTEDRTGPSTVIELPTSKGVPRREQRVGRLSFSFGGVTYSLTAFASEDEGTRRLFVPFRDLTSGTETYGGGRYLDLDRTATDLYDLDFNRAYHPFCVYNASYECPVPPPENRLPIAIRAGERLRP